MTAIYCIISDDQQSSFDQGLLAIVFAKYFRKLTKDYICKYVMRCVNIKKGRR
jgi:hypothetical protein